MSGEQLHLRIASTLDAVKRGEQRASTELLPLVYDDLKALAQRKLALERGTRTLQPTALVHEAYLRIATATEDSWDSRGHFFAAASESMRRILVEQARARQRLKRGGGQRRVEAPLEEIASDEPSERIVAVDRAVRRLAERDRRKARIVDLRYFAGLTAEETAATLDVSVGTIEREWRFIRAWLQRELAERSDD